MSLNVSFKHLTLKEIQKVIIDLGKLAESTLNQHSLALIISNSGEASFTRSGWKILTAAGCGSPIAKIITNTAKSYTNYCGEDCKFVLFILKEIMSALEYEVSRDESFTRMQIINDISSMKRALPCIFDSIRNSPDARAISSHLTSFSEKLHCIAQTFMLSRFSKHVSNHLKIVICDFVLGIKCGKGSLKVILEYVLSHFDCFCSKMVAPVSESRVLEGFMFYKKSIASGLQLRNSKFIIILDLSRKGFVNDVSLKICNASFIEKLNLTCIYQKLIRHFKKEGVELVLTPSAADKDIKLLCQENNICLLDRLYAEDIENILSCLNIFPLESLSDELESKHMGELKSFKSIFNNDNSFFLNLQCSNTARFLNAHHILLAAPFDALQKEYYSECRNCLKVIQQWIGTSSSYQTESVVVRKHLDTSRHNIIPCSSSELGLNLDNLKVDPSGATKSERDADIEQWIGPKFCFREITSAGVGKSLKTPNLCSSSKANVELGNLKVGLSDVVESEKDTGIALPPVLWEYLFLTFLAKASENMSVPCRSISQKLHFAVVKMVCLKMGVSFCSIRSLKDAYSAFSEKGNRNESNRLEPAICSEIMIYTVLDLLVQLLKIDGIVATK